MPEKQNRRRPHLVTTIAPDVKAALEREAAAEDLSIGRVLDRLVREALKAREERMPTMRGTRVST